MQYGTSYFVSREAAVRYYSPYYGRDIVKALDAVSAKLQTGEIHLGEPQVVRGERLIVNDEGRYVICSPE